MWEESIDIRTIAEIRVKTTVYLGVGAIARVDDMAADLAAQGVKCVLCVCGGSAYRKTGAFDHVQKACEAHGLELALYDRISPNPTTAAIDEAADLGLGKGASAVICIGGGSPIDAGKTAAVLLANPGVTAQQLYTGKFTPDKAAPIMVINLTHGTGSEANRFAVATIPGLDYKPAIAFDCLYPRFSIDDPALMVSLPANQTRYVSVDALNHSIEAATTRIANPLSMELAAECIRLVARWLPVAEKAPDDLRARYFLAYAALMAGVAFDNGLLHYTHALEHPLSAIKPELAHGLGLAMILPAVIGVIYPARPQVLSRLLAPLVPGLMGSPDEAYSAAAGVEHWLAEAGLPQKLEDEGFNEMNIARLTSLAQTTPSLDLLLSLSPVPASQEIISQIYRSSLRPMA